MIARGLSGSTGIPTVDATLLAVVSAFEHAFPARMRALYLIGSYAEQAAVPLSDIDCCVVMAHPFGAEDERALADAVGQRCAAASPLRLDISVCCERAISQLYPFFQVALKLGSLLVYGSDIRDDLALPEWSAYADDVAAGARFFIARLRGNTQLATPQVEYPDAADPFFGYTSKSIDSWYPAAIPAGTKELVATVSRIATALVVQQAQQYVPGKQQAIRLFQQHIGGPWAPFVAQIFDRCKRDWHYLVPASANERAELRALCEQMLAFENAFLRTCASLHS